MVKAEKSFKGAVEGPDELGSLVESKRFLKEMSD